MAQAQITRLEQLIKDLRKVRGYIIVAQETLVAAEDYIGEEFLEDRFTLSIKRRELRRTDEDLTNLVRFLELLLQPIGQDRRGWDTTDSSQDGL